MVSLVGLLKMLERLVVSRMQVCWDNGFVAGSVRFGVSSVGTSSSVRSIVLLGRGTPKNLVEFWVAAVRLTCGLGNTIGGD